MKIVCYENNIFFGRVFVLENVLLNLLILILQNRQTHSNNSLSFLNDEFF